MKMRSISLLGLILVPMVCIVSGEAILESVCLYQKTGAYINSIVVNDLDNDGLVEIISGSSDGVISDFNFNGCSTLEWNWRWQHNVKGAVRQIIVNDLDGDGEKELIAASNANTQYVVVLDYGGNFLWSDDDTGGYAISLDIADMNSDGINNVIYGTESGNLHVLKEKNNPLCSARLENRVAYIKVSDIDNDGNPDIVALSNKFGVKADLYVFDSNGNEKIKYSIDKGIYLPSKDTVAIADIDNDNNKEILVATYTKGVLIIDSNGKLKKSLLSGSIVNSVYASDLNGDGNIEIVAGSKPYLYIFDSYGNILSRVNVSDSVNEIISSDLNNDAVDEVIFGANSFIGVLDYNGNLIVKWDAGRNLKKISLIASDLDMDNIPEIVAGLGMDKTGAGQSYLSGELRVFRVKDIAVSTTLPTSTIVALTTVPTTTESTTTIERETTTLEETTTIGKEESGGSPLFIIIISVLFIIIVAVIGFFAYKKFH
ncbi:MAG TPA: VCBS repeat-containing protein [Candidatus Altiarchaeales archaeon]|nr:VCBS repeat-containing protein [Candidatus Altiarchaeales archaeon]